MSSKKKKHNIFGTVTFRLTSQYTIIFTGLSLLVFVLFYITLTTQLRQRMDEDLFQKSIEIEELSLKYSGEALRQEIKRETASHGTKTIFILIYSSNLELLAASDLTEWKGLELDKMAVDNLFSNREFFDTIAIPGHRHKIRIISKRIPDGKIIRLGHTLKDDEKLIKSYKRTAGIYTLLMVLCGSLLGWFVATQAMAGVKRVTRSAIRIGHGDLTHRVSLKNEGEEISNLAIAFNEMSEKIQLLVTELIEATDNIAHDLRSPVTRIRGIAETTFTGKQELDEYREMAGMVIEECDHLNEMINTMLEITVVESGNAVFSTTTVDMVGMIKNACELFQSVAEEKNILLKINTSSEPLETLGDISRLQRVIANLLDNAIKYSSVGGEITLSIKGTQNNIIISVADLGIGIDENDLPRIFKRFYRKDPSRSTPGSGLGLSLARATIRAHQGDITVESILGKGSTFTITLPRIFPSN